VAKKPKFEYGAWLIYSVDDLIRLFDTDKRLQPYLITQWWVSHLEKDYRDMPGVVHLGHTVDVPYVRVTPKPGGPVVEMLVACKEGLLTKEEAIGKEWIPNQAEIREHAARIRAEHETGGIVRRADYVGFDLRGGGMYVPGVGAAVFEYGQDADVFV
jgi:hypothetical protein